MPTAFQHQSAWSMQHAVSQLLSGSAGLTRDGEARGQFSEHLPLASSEEALADPARPPLIDTNTRFKYCNQGYALLGTLITAVTEEPHRTWVRRAVV